MDTSAQFAIEPPFVVVRESTFTARFAMAASEVESIDNVDVFVDLPDGSNWTLTIFTVDEVRRLLHHPHQTGDATGGTYFWVVDQLIVPRAGLTTMIAAIRELVRSNDITRTGLRADNRCPPIGAEPSNELP